MKKLALNLYRLLLVSFVAFIAASNIDEHPILTSSCLVLLMFITCASIRRHSILLAKANIFLLNVENIDHHWSGPLMFFSGRQVAWFAVFDKHLDQPAFITHSAIRHPDGTIYAVLKPGRHHHVIEWMSSKGKAGLANTRDQGFITNHGVYVDRQQALKIAEAVGQIIHKHGSDRELFSEDVWDSQQKTRK